MLWFANIFVSGAANESVPNSRIHGCSLAAKHAAVVWVSLAFVRKGLQKSVAKKCRQYL